MNDTLEIINCPACKKPMQKVFVPETGFNLDVCVDGCGGVFFDGQELKHFDENCESIEEIKKVLDGKIFAKVDESLTRNCPVCGNKMVKNFVSVKKNIQVDECYSCGAKFLDHNELEQMRAEYPTEKDRQQDFIASTYRDFGAEIEALDIQNKINYSKRSVFLKLLDKFFLR